MVVSLNSENSPDKAKNLYSLGSELNDRYNHSGDLADLQQAINAFQQAVALTPDDSPEKAGYLNSLGIKLHDRFNHTGDLDDLEQAIDAFKQAVKLTPDTSLDKADYLSWWGTGLASRYNRSGDFADLQQSIDALEQAIKLTPDNSPEQAMYLTNRGVGQVSRYNRTGDLADLEHAIDAFKQAVELMPDQAECLNNLGLGLSAHYRHTGDLADLKQGIDAYEQAVKLTPNNSPLDKAKYLTNLGSNLLDRYNRTENLDDLEQAIDYCEQAVELTPDTSPDKARYLSNLGIGLFARYKYSEDTDDLILAIDALLEAVKLMPDELPDKGKSLSNLGMAAAHIYQHTGDLDDLALAIDYYEEAVELTSDNSPDKVTCLNNLGTVLLNCYECTEDLADLEKAIDYYKQACLRGLEIRVEISLQSALNWENSAFVRQSWQEVEQAYNFAHQAIRQLLKIQLVRQNQENWLRDIQGLAANAAYAIAQKGELESAVLALEKGCARLLAEALERNRSDLQSLKEGEYAELYEHYQSATHRINRLIQVQQPDVEEIRQAKTQLDSVINQIQGVDGYQDFLAEPEIAHIAEVVLPDKPLVYLLTTTAGSLVLIVYKSVDNLGSIKVESIWLNKFRKMDLQELLGSTEWHEGWFGTYQFCVEAMLMNPAEKQVAHQDWIDTIDQTAQALWAALMGQVVQSLQKIGAEQAVLIPTGLLGFLPLHAAWTKDSNSPTGRRYASDSITFTYAPNARSLQTARAIAAQTQPVSVLAINQPKPVSASDLSSVDLEVKTVMAAFSASQATLQELKHEQATLFNVSKALQADYAVLHFACHGKVNLTEPLESGLLMANDEFLTLRELLNLRLKGARLAVLSACETGIPGEELPDEVVSLTSGLLQASVAGVVASLWAVSDRSTMLLLSKFYKLWLTENKEPSKALRQAQIWLRDSTEAEIAPLLGMRSRNPTNRPFSHPYYWAAFSYTGI